MSQSECSCKNKSPEMLEDGNCICADCKCHYYKRNIDFLGETEDILQQKIRNYGLAIVTTTTVLYGIYFFCCSNYPRSFISI